ncbi:rCG20248 [Rattus norvegicus]|uniref:RCG20248 n=1 Tax=Rattus norvegicus TaxID=10116 RepID=A6JGP2_RAT|nr:rCG20248 [Rattus norvegicus]
MDVTRQRVRVHGVKRRHRLNRNGVINCLPVQHSLTSRQLLGLFVGESPWMGQRNSLSSY